MKTVEALLAWGGLRKNIVFLVLSGVALLLSLFRPIPLPFDPAWVAIVLCGFPIVIEAAIGLVTEFDIRAGVLVSLALIAAIVIGEHFAAGEVAFIMQIGELLESFTVERARAGIERLVRLTPRTARRVTQGRGEVIPAERVAVGELLRVLPGETIPVDGVITAGQTSINQAVMTGEPLPVDKGVGDEVSSGTVNQFGAFDMRATRVGENSSIQRMIKLVQSADAGKAKIVGVADRWATWIVAAALLSAVLTWAVTGEIIRAVTILVVFCPCALVLATPTAIVAAIGNATKHGFLVREGDALERLASVSRVTFDKTGTLTRGTPEVTALHSFKEGLSEEELYLRAAAVELNSEHPLGKAVVSCYRRAHAREIPSVEGFVMTPARGVEAALAGERILAGNTEMLAQEGIELPQYISQSAAASIEEGCTVIYLALDGEVAGFLSLADTLRGGAAATIRGVKAVGATPVLLTGDHTNAAQRIAAQLEIAEVHAHCLPEDKLAWIDARQRERENVCMIGDGINDAPALKKRTWASRWAAWAATSPWTPPISHSSTTTS